MLHWNSKKTNKQVGNWKSTNVVKLQEDSYEHIDLFAKFIIQAIGFQKAISTATWFPGFLFTVEAYQQVPHVDIPYEYEMLEENKQDISKL